MRTTSKEKGYLIRKMGLEGCPVHKGCSWKKLVVVRSIQASAFAVPQENDDAFWGQEAHQFEAISVFLFVESQPKMMPQMFAQELGD